MVAGERCDVGLWDTASEEEMDRLRPLAYAEADLFVLCFSVVQVGQSVTDLLGQIGN